MKIRIPSPAMVVALRCSLRRDDRNGGRRRDDHGRERQERVADRPLEHPERLGHDERDPERHAPAGRLRRQAAARPAGTARLRRAAPGTPGPAGPQGPAGPKGSQGAKGATGAKGAPCTTGPKGANGRAGASGGQWHRSWSRASRSMSSSFSKGSFCEVVLSGQARAGWRRLRDGFPQPVRRRRRRRRERRQGLARVCEGGPRRSNPQAWQLHVYATPAQPSPNKSPYAAQATRRDFRRGPPRTSAGGPPHGPDRMAAAVKARPFHERARGHQSRASRRASSGFGSLPWPYVYNPLDYARAPHEAYLERWGAKRPREVLFVGMNPGPFGMAQTGVPFGDVAMVRDFARDHGRRRQAAARASEAADRRVRLRADRR